MIAPIAGPIIAAIPIAAPECDIFLPFDPVSSFRPIAANAAGTINPAAKP